MTVLSSLGVSLPMRSYWIVGLLVPSVTIDSAVMPFPRDRARTGCVMEGRYLVNNVAE